MTALRSIARAFPMRRAQDRRMPWTVTFADMCLLLMGFFVLQVTTSDGGTNTRVSGSLAEIAGPRIVPVVGAAPNALAVEPTAASGFDASDAAAAGLALGKALAEGRVEIVRIGESVALHFTALEDAGRDDAALKRRTADALEALARLATERESADKAR